jgi:glycerophosphoryl diester phosphodiesterase
VLSEVVTRDPKQTLADAKAQTLWQERTTLDEPLVTTVHNLGASIIAWTVDAPPDMQRLVGWGVDGICTNHPERARPIVDASRAA